MTGHADRPALPARRIARRRLRPLRAARCKSEVTFAPSDLCLRLAACGAKRTTNGKSASDRQKDDRAAKGAVALRSHSKKQLLALSRYPEVDIPCDERSIATLVGSS